MQGLLLAPAVGGTMQLQSEPSSRLGSGLSFLNECALPSLDQTGGEDPCAA